MDEDGPIGNASIAIGFSDTRSPSPTFRPQQFHSVSVHRHLFGPFLPKPHSLVASSTGMVFAYLLVVLHLVEFAVGDDALQLVEALLHQREAQPGGLLLLPDSLQLPAAHLLGHAGALLPLLDPLRDDLVDATAHVKMSSQSLRMEPHKLIQDVLIRASCTMTYNCKM